MLKTIQRSVKLNLYAAFLDKLICGSRAQDRVFVLLSVSCIMQNAFKNFLNNL
jgi:hypothetical protein